MSEQPPSNPQENPFSASSFLQEDCPTPPTIVIYIDQSFAVYHNYHNSQNQTTTEFINSNNDNSTRARNSSLNGDAGRTFYSGQALGRPHAASYSPASGMGGNQDRLRSQPPEGPLNTSQGCIHTSARPSLNDSSRRLDNSRLASYPPLAGIPSLEPENITSDLVGRVASLPHRELPTLLDLGRNINRSLNACQHDFAQHRYAPLTDGVFVRIQSFLRWLVTWLGYPTGTSVDLGVPLERVV